jgi:uncharacterized surface protein with fasciclin (FAS1) repeats
MKFDRLLTAAAAVAMAAAVAPNALAQTPATAKTEAQAQAATGKPSSDGPAGTAVQGTAKAVKQGAASATTGTAANVQATETAQPAPAATPAPAAGAPAKPVAVQGDLVDTLRLNGQFTTFLKGVDATNLTGLLKTNKNLTVFAPTDAAFAAMPPAELAHLQSDKTAMQKFLLHHIINAPIPSSKIKGAKGPVPSGAGDQVMLDGSDESGTLKADGATIVQSDVQTGSGLVQVVDHVLVPGAGGAAETAAAPAAASASTGTGADASAAAKPKS